ncbi:MAG: dTMP kinase [Pseudomonadota bacterium]
MAERGKFITFEGGEGSGKSTQVALLAEHLRAQGRSVVETREPGGCPGAEEIRALLVSGDPGRWEPLSEALLHYAARRQHLSEVVWPALEDGSWVISDRFADSTLAYQGYGQGLAHREIETLYRLVVGARGPDLTLILDLPVEQGLARAEAVQRYERMDRAFHERLRQGFLEIAQGAPERCRVIDATGDVAQVRDAVRAAVEARWP